MWGSFVLMSIILNTFSLHLANKLSYNYIVKLKISFMGALFNKVNSMSSFTIKDANIGKLVNLASNDFNSVETKIFPFFLLLMLPLTLIAATFILVER